MCGICGAVADKQRLTVDRALLDAMTAVLRHRGPDDVGHYLARVGDTGIGLGHTRLSIIDLAGGHQPLSNEDGSLWIVFNGEIYNFLELRPGLEQRGHVFKTRSDTEVILHLYEDKDADCLADLRGMFAFAIWDQRRSRLFLARDRLGVKPLCYHHRPGCFLFASELKALLQVPGFRREVNREAIHHYLTYQYVPYPLTILKDAQKLPPAHYLLCEHDQVQVRRYWEPDFGAHLDLTEAQWAERIRHELAEATKLRLIADVPLGAFLSGGVDSSITVGLMSQAVSAAGGVPVKTFSIGFQEKRYDELDFARIVARRFKTDHHEFIVRPDILDILPKLVWHYDEPFADSSAIPTYYLSKVTREHVKVALTGDAGDECFAGYPRYRAVKLAGYVDRLPGVARRLFTPKLWGKLPASLEHRTFRRQLKRVAESLSLPPRQRYLEWVCIYNDARTRWLYSDDMLAEFALKPSLRFLDEHYDRWPGKDFLGQTTYVDMMTYLPNDILVKVDIASMAHALETRSPFLDYKVVELAAALPTRLKMRGLSTKHVLKKAFADLLPPEILRRGKMGFGAPIADWFRNELSRHVQDVLLSPTSLQRGYFREAAVRQLVDDHIQRRADHGYRLWALFMLELWHREFADAAPQPRPVHSP